MADYLTAPGLSLTQAERILTRDLAALTAARFGPDCLMVNIGVALGGTCVCLRAGAPQARIIGIDVDPESVPGDWLFIHGDSRRVHEGIASPVHLLLVDGDHDYYGVRADILNWCPKLSPGGIVLFHDYGNAEIAPHTAGVKRAVDELMNDEEWVVIGEADSIKAFQRRAST